MSEITMLKKLGAKQILGNIKAVVNTLCENDGDTYKAYSIVGQANGVRTGTSQYGEFYAFQGQMEAINYVDGTRFAATQCFIPEPLQSMLLDALNEHDQIEFAFTVSVKRRDDLKEGYEYLVQPHHEAQEADPLEKLRNMLPAPEIAGVALEAPAAKKAPAKKAPAKKAAKKK